MKALRFWLIRQLLTKDERLDAPAELIAYLDLIAARGRVLR